MLYAKQQGGGMVVAPHHLAAEAGCEMLRAGGNAIEAMVAAAATISVVYPHMNGLGGDGRLQNTARPDVTGCKSMYPKVLSFVEGNDPVVTWINYGVHGAESSGMDASLPFIYYLAAAEGDKVSLVAGVTKDLTDRVKAGDLMKHVAGQVGGKGGGRPDMAQGGGTDAAALPAALESAYRWVAGQL